jgi:hypothetical protein
LSARLIGGYRYATKRLSAVEASRVASNQHELNGSAALRELLGTEHLEKFPTRWYILDDDRGPRVEEHTCSWYDARETHPTRTEWRLYFSGDPEIGEGDVMVLLRREPRGDLVVLVAKNGSTWSDQLIGLLGMPDQRAGTFAIREFSAIPEIYADFASDLFDLLGWSVTEPPRPTNELDQLHQRFGDALPSSSEFSAFARSIAPISSSDPDTRLLAWWRKEDELFRMFEAADLGARLKRTPPFKDVPEFIDCALSVLNRRKSRAGLAFENHVEELLRQQGLRYTRGPRTEGNRRPDFVLPGECEYHSSAFTSERLTMLAAKTTCKDRWRQVLNEAARIPVKHLLTLEPGISTTQLEEMAQERLVLVAPAEHLHTYSPPPGMRVLSVTEFLAWESARQRTGCV